MPSMIEKAYREGRVKVFSGRWAAEFYKANGFETGGNSEELLRKYWDILERQVEESVALRYRGF